METNIDVNPLKRERSNVKVFLNQIEDTKDGCLLVL